jgi:hypothetical protein
MADGTIKINGAEASFHSYRIITEVFEAMIRQRAFAPELLGTYGNRADLPKRALNERPSRDPEPAAAMRYWSNFYKRANRGRTASAQACSDTRVGRTSLDSHLYRSFCRKSQ